MVITISLVNGEKHTWKLEELMRGKNICDQLTNNESLVFIDKEKKVYYNSRHIVMIEVTDDTVGTH